MPKKWQKRVSKAFVTFLEAFQSDLKSYRPIYFYYFG